MTITNAPGGLSSFGIPLTGGLPFRRDSRSFYVDYEKGLDGNRGDDPSTPFKTLSKAHGVCVAGRHDRVFLIGNGQTTGTARESATLVWSKDQTHLIGVCAPTAIAQRARIATESGVNFTPLINITAAGCIFSNIHAFHGYATASAQICVTLTGAERNYFYNCHFAGMGNATAAAQAGGASLKIDGGASFVGENTFENCTIGLDTISRTTTNAELIFAGATPRNVFRQCLFPTYAGNAGHLFISAPATSIDRFALFDGCIFNNAINSSATVMTAAISVNASAGGTIILKDTGVIGATDWAAASTALIQLLGAAPATSTTGLSVQSTT